MVNALDYLNVRYSTRKLTDEQFEELLPSLAEEVCRQSFYQRYNNKALLDDWTKLCKWTPVGSRINSTSRIGMKLCEHFFPNFYSIENAKGQSFHSLWTKDNLIKILRWNRKSHSTPYMSELRRGVYFCCGLPKSTMYRPQMMKMACTRYGAKIVLDPCAGWGGRMLGAVAAGCEYWAFEPNTETHQHLIELADFLGISRQVNIYCDDARNMGDYPVPTVDLVLTSPPYFDLEVYTKQENQSITGCGTYRDWRNAFLEPVIQGCLGRLKQDGHSCWNVGKVGSHNMASDVASIHDTYGYTPAETLAVVSSKRQVNQSSAKNGKSSDDTVVFTKNV